MKSFTKRFYSFRADANALGGYLEEPYRTNVPTLAPVSLPAVGGFAMARSEAFTFDGIISCSLAYTRVSGREDEKGATSTLITAAVEDLNILGRLTARRIVAQVSISDPNSKEPIQISREGSVFEDLRVDGQECRLKLNSELQQPQNSNEGRGAGLLTWPGIAQVGQAQARNLIQGFKRWGTAAHEWVEKRHGNPQPGSILCSLVDGIEGCGDSICSGHMLDIRGFGRVTLGELRVSGDSVQLVMLRADLGCPVTGGVTISCVGGGGTGDN